MFSSSIAGTAASPLPLLPTSRRSPFGTSSATGSHSSPRSIRTSRLLPLLRASSPTARAFLSSSSTPLASAAAAPPNRIDSLDQLFAFRQRIGDATPSEIVDAWETQSKLWETTATATAAASSEQKLVLEDEQSWRMYLKALAAQVGAVETTDGGEALTRGLKKLAEAESRRNQVLDKMGWKSSLYPEPAAAASDTTIAAPPSTSPLSKLSPSALISALFSSSASRGKGGEAKIKSTGSFGAWLNNGNGNGGNSASAQPGSASEPIRVVVEEAKSPLVWRIVKFVAVTALYSFLLSVSF